MMTMMINRLLLVSMSMFHPFVVVVELVVVCEMRFGIGGRLDSWK